MPKPPKEAAIDRLERARSNISSLREAPENLVELSKWRRNTEIVLMHTFGAETRHGKEFMAISYIDSAVVRIAGGDYTPERSAAFLRGLDVADALLQSMIDEIKEYWDTEGPIHRFSNSVPGEETEMEPTSNRIFIVHGHDDGFKNTVARVLTQLGLEPIILHERPSLGRTVIEKFESYADVAFAVVLFTPDDLGESKAQVKRLSDLKPRVRQNVLFELGYFIGRHKRARVCALVMSGIEKPSDYAGVAYIGVGDNDAWKYELVRELQAARFRVSADSLLK